MEKIVETKKCNKCSMSFDITDIDIDFYSKLDLEFNWERIKMPSPSFCPECRNIRRMTRRNEWKLYKRKCDKTWRDIISIYCTDKDLIIYDINEWNKWDFDSIDFWIELEFDKNFFEQFNYLLRNTPIPSMTFQHESENSEYSILTSKAKNCYMLFASWDCEDSFYSTRLIKTKTVYDSIDWTNLERCYQVINSENLYWCSYILNSNNCQNCSFSYDLENCSDCVLCYNLVWKKYCINNKQYSKEKYFIELNRIRLDLFLNWWKFLDEILKKAINKDLMMVSCENSLWDNLKNCKNCKLCFHFEEAENCKYWENGWMWCYNSYDWRGFGANLQFWYEVLDTWVWAVKNYFLISCYWCRDTYYSMNCHNSNNLFGCIWLKNKSYCILNKQYTKEEYNELLPKLINKMIEDKEWWEFFPSTNSIFGYNETPAMEYFPITKDIAITRWFNWSDYKMPIPEVEKVIKSNMLPDDINDIPDDILNWAIECSKTWKKYKIVKLELDFYRKNNIPVPRLHPEERHLERVKINNPKEIFENNCEKCSKQIKTVFSRDSNRRVYCESCYNNEIY